MRALDRLTNATRRGIERWVPWYDPAEALERRRETERVRLRSIKARLRVEEVAESYQRADRAIRR